MSRWPAGAGRWDVGSKKFRNREHQPPGRSFQDILDERRGKFRNVFEAKPEQMAADVEVEAEWQRALIILLYGMRDAMESGDHAKARQIERRLNSMGFGIEADMKSSELVLVKIGGAREVDKSSWLSQLAQSYPDLRSHPEFPSEPPNLEARREARRRMDEFNRRNPYPWSTSRPFEAKPAKEEPIEPPRLKVPGLEQSLEFLANDFLDELEGDSK